MPERASRFPSIVKTHLSGISTLYYVQVAGLHRASPSATLDKHIEFYFISITYVKKKIKGFIKKYVKICVQD